VGSAYFHNYFFQNNFVLAMPAKQTRQTGTPNKAAAVSEDIVGHQWCVTQRLGLYVYEYEDQSQSSDELVKQSLTRVGLVTAVSWSGVYNKKGHQKAVFKLQVTTRVDEAKESKVYVVQEDMFTNFSSAEWRESALDCREDSSICNNVCPDLLSAHATHLSTKSTSGKWLKNWLASYNTDKDSSITPQGATGADVPNVFGAANPPNLNNLSGLVTVSQPVTAINLQNFNNMSQAQLIAFIQAREGQAKAGKKCSEVYIEYMSFPPRKTNTPTFLQVIPPCPLWALCLCWFHFQAIR
jgi:hypothetical protein